MPVAPVGKIGSNLVQLLRYLFRVKKFHIAAFYILDFMSGLQTECNYYWTVKLKELFSEERNRNRTFLTTLLKEKLCTFENPRHNFVVVIFFGIVLDKKISRQSFS